MLYGIFLNVVLVAGAWKGLVHCVFDRLFDATGLVCTFQICQPSATEFNLGRNWNNYWLSYVEDTDPGAGAVLLAPGGGERDYTPDGVTKEYRTQTSMQRLTEEENFAGFIIRYPNGSMNIFRQVVSGSPDRAYLTEKVTSAGVTNRLQYEINSGVLQLKYVVDGDGRTSRLYYTNTLAPELITGVEDAFGRTISLVYDDVNKLLTNITDVAGLSSSFVYDEQNWVTNLVTPYGTTTFAYTEQSDNGVTFGGDNIINRSVLVTQPDGGKHLYLYRDRSDYLDSSHEDEFLPASYDSGLLPTDTPLNTLDNVLMQWRNSFHWGPLQYAALSTTDMASFSVADYNKARMRHWLQNADWYGGKKVTDTLSMQRAPSPDSAGSILGQMTWYDYDGKEDSFAQGTSKAVAVIARVLPGGETQYNWTQRNEWGHPTSMVSTYSLPEGSVALRTNTFVFAENGIDLIQHFGPEDVFENGYAFDEHHQLLMHTNAVGEVTFYTYNEKRRLTSIVRPSGLTTTNIYFEDGDYVNWLDRTIDVEIHRTNSYTYADGLVLTHTDERGLTVEYTWDELQRLRRVDYTDGTFVTNAYAKLDLVRTVDRMGFPATFGHDSMGRLIATTNALGYVTLNYYCACGSLDSVQDAEGNLTQFFYDNLGRVMRTLSADGFAVTNHYNAVNQVTNVIDGSGASTTNWFNVQGLQYAVSNAFGRVSTVVFDIEDRATTTVDVNGVISDMTYDHLGRLLTRIYSDGVESFGYSARGMIAYTNKLELITHYGYDEAGRKIAETNANLEITRFSYDASGNLTNLLDGKEQNTWWVYDEYSRVTNKWDHLENLLFLYKYDPNSRLTNRWSAAKGATIYRYDPVHNLTNVDYANSADLSMQYDALKRLTNMIDGVGNTKYGYDVVGQLLSEDGPWDQDTVNYSYQHRLRRGTSVQQRNASAWALGYSYDSARRLTGVTSPVGSFSYDYHPVQHYLVRKLTLPGSAYITNAFDAETRLLTTKLNNSAHDTLNLHSYEYNEGNQRTKQTRTDGSFVNYAYDSIGQLLRADGREEGGSPNRLHEQIRYGYDAAGNLNFRTNNGFVQTFNVNELNELTTVARDTTNFTVAGTTTSEATSVTVNSQTATLYDDATFVRTNLTLADGNNTFTAVASDALGRSSTDSATVFLPETATYEYDLNGNLLSDGRRGFEYDDENQLIKVTVTNAWKSEFSYDGKMRRRIRKEYGWSGSDWSLTNEVRYVYDGNLVIQERDNLNLGTVTYTRGKDLSGSLEGAGGIGGLLARTANGRLIGDLLYHHAYYHCDGNGNVTCLINTNQFVVAKYLYDPFGNTLSASGPLAEANLYRFSSKEFHPNSGLVYYLYRHYESGLQRWINRDPIHERGGINLFAYVRNAPIDMIDRFGNSWLSRCGAWLCARNAALMAENQVNRSGIDGNSDRTGGNAFKHCLAACYVSLQCGEAGEKSWDRRENPKTAAGRQDLANNNVGYMMAKKEGSCWDNCMNVWMADELYCGGEPCPPPQERVAEPELIIPGEGYD